MTKIAAIQMDPLDGIDINADSSFVLGLEAQRRGYQLFHYLTDGLCYDRGAVVANGAIVRLQRKQGDHVSMQDACRQDLRACAVVLMRQDPPFDMGYIAATHILERLAPDCLVVNDPVSVRNAPEKLLVTHFQDLMPATMITRDMQLLREFYQEHGDIIIKPLFGNGGAGIFYVRQGDANFAPLLETMLGTMREPLIAQKFLPKVRNGDKRIVLIDGAVAGAINRVPQAGEIRSNMHAGGTAMPCSLDARDHEICERLQPILRSWNLLFTGIDVIDGYLTEINVTSPTGLQEIGRFHGRDLAADIWDAIEGKLHSA